MPELIVRYRAGDGANWGKLLSAPPHRGDERLHVAPFVQQVATGREMIALLDSSGGQPEQAAAVEMMASALLSPVTRDAQLVCQGLNYRDHSHESGHAARKENLLFFKAPSSLCGAFDPVIRPADCELLDYEVEVGLVLRRPLEPGYRMEDGALGDWIAGVVLCNDVSARDVMFGAPFLQWARGKSYRTFCPAGPVLCYFTSNEVAPALADLRIHLAVNGEARQSASSGDWIFGPTATLSHIAAFMDMAAGDVILTGTPGGVVAQATPPVAAALREKLFNDEARRDAIVEALDPERFLQPGDVMELEMTMGGQTLGGQRSTIGLTADRG